MKCQQHDCYNEGKYVLHVKLCRINDTVPDKEIVNDEYDVCKSCYNVIQGRIESVLGKPSDSFIEK